MAKKALKKRSKKKTKARASSLTRCEQGGSEILPIVIRVKPADDVSFVLYICRTNSNVLVYLDGAIIAEAENSDQVAVDLPTLGPGKHLLYWSWTEFGPNWQSRDEVAVNGAVRFRRRKSARGDRPVNSGFVFLEVAP